MDCTQFSDRLDALLDGTLAAGEQTPAEAHVVACSRCRALYMLMRGDLESPVETPDGLTESILARTSGRACPGAQTMLGDYADVPSENWTGSWSTPICSSVASAPHLRA